VRDGGLAGWGVIRPCQKGRKIGPLVADDRATAEVVLSALLASVGGGEIFLDVPSINRDAVAFAPKTKLAVARSPTLSRLRKFDAEPERLCSSRNTSATDIPARYWIGRPGADARSDRLA